MLKRWSAFIAAFLLGIVLAAATLLMAVLFLAEVFGTGPSSSGATPESEPQLRTLTCSPNHFIITIYGTDSTGQFEPHDPIRALDPRNLDRSMLTDAPLNDDFDELLGHDVGSCRLTFSYDDVYLDQNGVSNGLNAWNVSQSVWNRKPDQLAGYLQKLIDFYPSATFDIIAYSAGGIVPTYWAARAETTDRSRVHSIIVVDGIVWGVDVGLDGICALPFKSIRNADFGYGKLACQLGYASPFTTAVRTTDRWRTTALATVRAKGDLIVWHRFAGLPGQTVDDPSLRATLCPFSSDWFDVEKAGKCVMQTHGSVLGDDAAARTVRHRIASP